jgi:small GTP-binding protein
MLPHHRHGTTPGRGRIRLCVETLERFQNEEIDGDLLLEEMVIKVALCGKEQSGKSAVLSRFTNGPFNWNEYETSIGLNLASASVHYHGSTEPLRVEVWDTSGETRFRTVVRSTEYYRKSSAVVFCYAVDEVMSTLIGAPISVIADSVFRPWVEDIFSSRKSKLLLPIACGTKCDLVAIGPGGECDLSIFNSKMELALTEALSNVGLKPHLPVKGFMTSAKLDTGISSLLQYVVDRCCAQVEAQDRDPLRERAAGGPRPGAIRLPSHLHIVAKEQEDQLNLRKGFCKT